MLLKPDSRSLKPDLKCPAPPSQLCRETPAVSPEPKSSPQAHVGTAALGCPAEQSSAAFWWRNALSAAIKTFQRTRALAPEGAPKTVRPRCSPIAEARSPPLDLL